MTDVGSHYPKLEFPIITKCLNTHEKLCIVLFITFKIVGSVNYFRRKILAARVYL